MATFTNLCDKTQQTGLQTFEDEGSQLPFCSGCTAAQLIQRPSRLLCGVGAQDFTEWLAHSAAVSLERFR
jgi:hypothetical protein